MHLKNGEAKGIDGVERDMVKYSGETADEWILKVWMEPWENGCLPDELMKAIIVQLHNGGRSKGR